MHAVVSDSICDPMDCSLPSSSVHGILQERILKWVAISFSNLEEEVYNNNKKCDWKENLKKKKLKSLIIFRSANKSNSYNNRGWGWGEKRKEKVKRIYRTSQNIRIINAFFQLLLSESFPSVGVTDHLTSLGCSPTICWSLDQLWEQLRF